MPDGTPYDASLIYPTPAIVVGMGRLGLATLERLGEDWSWLGVSDPQPSHGNLRLVYLRAGTEQGEDGAPSTGSHHVSWRERERFAVSVALYVGDRTGPSRAADFALLRSLGLIRYHDGLYQLCVPRDDGVVDVPADPPPPCGVSGGSPEEGAGVEEPAAAPSRGTRAARRRFFAWVDLDADPLVAVERLWETCERVSEVDLFVRPILSRVHEGHSPQLLLAAVSRCMALADGRDPSPWGWLHRETAQAPVESDGDCCLTVQPRWLNPHDLLGLLDGHAELPLPGLAGYIERCAGEGAVPERAEAPAPILRVPQPFVPREGDLASPLDPKQLLWTDWERAGWACAANDAGQDSFEPVASSDLRLGLLDHEDQRGRDRSDDDVRAAALAERLKLLGQQVHRGLARLWVDLERSLTRRTLDEQPDGHFGSTTDDLVRQSVGILGELIIRPIIENDHSLSVPEPPVGREDVWVDGDPLPEEPSPFLSGLVVGRQQKGSTELLLLRRRFQDLGLLDDPGDDIERRLLREVRLLPSDLASESTEASLASLAEDHTTAGVRELRRVVNEEVRHLYHEAFLASYRVRPTRRPPRLTVYVVCDMGEPFARATVRTVLRELHTELLRAFGPIFDTYHRGLDRALAIVPILWMPHASDAFGGSLPLENRCEEAAIIEAVHGLRRWAESIPRSILCVPQIFVNGRVTDNAVVSLRGAARQTRDYITLQVRHSVARDEWLRWTAASPDGSDLFSSFSCYEIDFPAHRAREYLANRLARVCMALLHRAEVDKPPRIDVDLAPPEPDALCADADGALAKVTDGFSQQLEGQVLARRIGWRTPPAEGLERFDEAFQAALGGQVHDRWAQLARRRGEMDGLVDQLRRGTTTSVRKAVARVRRASDDLIDQHAAEGGIKRAQAGFAQMRTLAGEALRGAEGDRIEGEGACGAHGIPSLHPIGTSREAVCREIEAKPHAPPMLVGLIAWAIMALALGAPISYGLARLFELDQRAGNGFELLLGPGGSIVGAVLLTVPLFFALRCWMLWRVSRVNTAVEAMSRALRLLVHGPPERARAGAPSLRSFFEARVHFAAALASRGYAQSVYEQVLRDVALADRLDRSVNIQNQILLRQAEALGVRPSMDPSDDLDQEDTRWVFSTGDGERTWRLIDPAHLGDYYRCRIGDDHHLGKYLSAFVRDTGEFAQWRKVACLSDTARIMSYVRREFQHVVDTPVSRVAFFEAEAGANLCEFVARCYSTIGFGAKFVGYEGMDQDGILVLADATLILHPELADLYQQARGRPDTPASTQTLEIRRVRIRPDTGYLLSVVHDIGVSSIRNLMRFESSTAEPHVPVGWTFPLSGEGDLRPDNPITTLTWHHGLRRAMATTPLFGGGGCRCTTPSVPEGAAPHEAPAREALDPGEGPQEEPVTEDVPLEERAPAGEPVFLVPDDMVEAVEAPEPTGLGCFGEPEGGANDV
ncbi:MAG: hypothetical protein ABIO70_12425 [Pseudomonadota bacterium]